MSARTAAATPGYWTLTATVAAVVQLARGRPGRSRRPRSARRRTRRRSRLIGASSSDSITLRMSLKRTFGRGVAQRAELALELLAVLLGHEPDVEEAHHLPELHRRALHRPERGHDLLGGLEVAALERGALALVGSRQVRRVRAELARRLARRRGSRRGRCARSARSGSGPWPSARAYPSGRVWPRSAGGGRRGWACRGATDGVGVGVPTASASASPPRSRVGVAVSSPSSVAVGGRRRLLVVAGGLASACRRTARSGAWSRRSGCRRSASSEAVTTAGADDGGDQAGDDRDAATGSGARGLLAARAGRTGRPRVPQRRDLLRPFAARADAGRLLLAHRRAGGAAARHGGVTDVITSAGLRSTSETIATMIGVNAVAITEPRVQNDRHHDRRGGGREARDDQSVWSERPLLLLLLFGGSPLRR